MRLESRETQVEQLDNVEENEEVDDDMEPPKTSSESVPDNSKGNSRPSQKKLISEEGDQPISITMKSEKFEAHSANSDEVPEG